MGGGGPMEKDGVFNYTYDYPSGNHILIQGQIEKEHLLNLNRCLKHRNMD